MTIKMRASMLLMACFVFSLIEVNKSQQTVCSSLESDVDYKGNDLSFTYDAKSARACANICGILFKSCSGFTFWSVNENSSICFLKNFTQTPNRYPAKDRVSCIMVRQNPNPTTTTSMASSTTPNLPASTTVPVEATTTPVVSTTTVAPARELFESNNRCLINAPQAFYGDVHAYDFMNAESALQCCDLCSQESSQCAAFSFLEDKKMCYIYSNPLPNQLFRNNTIGGVLNPNYKKFASNYKSKSLF